jgi:hypothetical protein
MEVIWVRRERKYFCKQDWTASIILIRYNKSPCLVNPNALEQLACLSFGRFARGAIDKGHVDLQWQADHARMPSDSTRKLRNNRNR